MRHYIRLIVLQIFLCTCINILIIIDFYSLLIVNTAIHPCSEVSPAYYYFESARKFWKITHSDLRSVIWREWGLLIRCAILVALALPIAFLTGHSLYVVWSNFYTAMNVHCRVGGHSTTHLLQCILRYCGMRAFMSVIGIVSIVAIPASLHWGCRMQSIAVANHIRPIVISILKDCPHPGTKRYYSNYGYLYCDINSPQRVWGFLDGNSIHSNCCRGRVFSLPETGYMFTRSCNNRRVGINVDNYRFQYMVFSLDDDSIRYGSPLATLSSNETLLNVYLVGYGETDSKGYNACVNDIMD